MKKQQRKCVYFTEDALTILEEIKTHYPRCWKYGRFSLSAFFNYLIEKEREYWFKK